MRESHIVPLYFSVDNSGFSFGTQARERYYAHDPNAYGHYFELIKDPSKHFMLHGSPKRIKQLLYYGIEQYLSHFLNTILYDNNSIESRRSDFPLRFIFEPDLGEPERSLVKSLFTEAGYRNLAILDFHDILLGYLRSTGVAGKAQPVLYLSGLDDTLYVELYTKDAGAPVATLSLEGQGADPRTRILAEMIVEYIAVQNHYLNLDTATEASGLLTFCAGLLAKAEPILSGEAELSKGEKFWFSVKLKSVEDRLQYYTGDMMISASISDLLQNHTVHPETVLVLLGSEEIRTPYFSGRILRAYPNIRGIEPLHTEGAMQLIFDLPSAGREQQTPSGVANLPGTMPRAIPDASPPVRPPVLPVKPAAPPLPAAKPQVAKAAEMPPLPERKTDGPERAKRIVQPPLPPPKKT
jgi:hypothetical protein